MLVHIALRTLETFSGLQCKLIGHDSNGAIKTLEYPKNFEALEGTLPSKKDFDAKYKEMVDNIIPYELLREERNKLLAETDWMASSDREPSKAQKDYRQALRDLPSTANPKLVDNLLSDVDWPTKPE